MPQPPTSRPMGILTPSIVSPLLRIPRSPSYRLTKKPSLFAACAVVQRVPLQILLAQVAAGRVELRRLIELTFLTVYFTDHPIEWAHFERTPGEGINTARDTPIAAAAHREPSYYASYVKELMVAEPSGLALGAARDLAVIFGMLSSSVHAASASLKILPDVPIGQLTSSEMSAFLRDYRAVAANAIIVLAAFRRRKFDSFPPAYRAWFDWLVGAIDLNRFEAVDSAFGRQS